jgi:hypothetical protein
MMEGHLSKWTNALTGWKRRYFILEAEHFTYFRKQGGKSKGTIDLTQAKVVPNTLYPTRFKILNANKYMHLKAYSVEEARKWLACLLKLHALADSIDNSILTVQQSPRNSLSPDRLTLVMTQLKLLNHKVVVLAKTLQVSGVHKATVKELVEAADASSLLLSQVGHQFDDVQASENSSLNEFYDAVEEASGEVHRLQLPAQREPGLKHSIWKVIKDSIGKELSKVSVPVYFNEPLGFLQRYSEELTYVHLLEEASQKYDPVQRLALVAAFASSPYSCSVGRTMKPFNSLLGETFELQKGRLKMIAEQVSHHPPITALHTEHPDFKFWGSMHPTTKFKGSYIQVRCIGEMHVEFPHLGEHYVWDKPNSSIHNVIVGSVYIDHHGSFTVRDMNSPARAEIHFAKRGWLSASSREVRGEVFDGLGTVKYTITGNWSTHFELHNLENYEDQRIWEPFPPPPDYEQNYFMTEFALQLNHPPECYPGLPSTDTRYRPDQRAYENGDIDTAIAEKDRLEEKQRAAKRLRDEANEVWSPKWFGLCEGEWRYKGGYWKQRVSGQFESVPDIFS